MVRSIRGGLAGLTLLLFATAIARGNDDPPASGGPKPPDRRQARPAERARDYALPGEDPPDAFVPVRPRTVEDRTRVESLTEYCVARALEDKRDWTGAIRLYEKALEREPNSVTVLRRLSRLNFLLGRTEAGVKFCRRVLAVDPGDTDTIARLVHYYVNRKGDPAAAEAVLNEVIASPKLDAHAPGRLLAYYELGELYTGKLRNAEKAADAYAKVVEALDDRAASRLSPVDQARIFGGDEGATYQKFGLAFLEAKRFPLAITAFERGLDYHPDDPELPLLLARTLNKLGQNDRALGVVERFLRRQPQGVEGYELQALILTALKRENEITPRLEEAARKDPRNVALQYTLADRYRETGQVEKADALYKALLTAQPTTQAYGALAQSLLRRKKAEELIRIVTEAVGRAGGAEAVQDTIKAIIADPPFAEQVLDAGARLLALDPPGLPRQGVAVLAVIATRTNKIDRFLPVQRLELQRHPSPQAFKELAVVLISLHQYREALSTFEEMFTRYPGERNARNLTEVVRLYRLSDQNDEAVKAAREAVKLDPNDADAQVQLALTLSQTGKGDEAVTLLRGLVKKDPNNPETQLMLGGVLTQLGRNEEALTVFKDLIARNPGNDEVVKLARSNLSIIYVNMGDYAKGEAELEILLQKEPDDPGVNNDLGYLYADQGKNLERAEAMIRKAVESLKDDPDNRSYGAYLDSLGWVLFKRGKAREAVEPLERAVQKLNETSGTDATVYEHLGDVYFHLQEMAKAKQAWEAAEKAALKSTPPDKRLAEIRRKLASLAKLGQAPRPATGHNP